MKIKKKDELFASSNNKPFQNGFSFIEGLLALINTRQVIGYEINICEANMNELINMMGVKCEVNIFSIHKYSNNGES